MLLKWSACAVVFCCVHYIAHAQNTIGLQGGVNFSTLNGGSYANLVGFHGGIVVNKQISSTWSLQPGVLFSLQGANVERDGGGNIRYKLSYLNLPLLIKAQLGHSFYVIMGPQFGTLLNAVERSDEASNNISYLIRPIDLSACLGFGFSVAEAMQFQFAYNYGLTQTLESVDESVNLVFQAGVIYFIHW